MHKILFLLQTLASLNHNGLFKFFSSNMKQAICSPFNELTTLAVFLYFIH
jgi:hypothetical protein